MPRTPPRPGSPPLVSPARIARRQLLGGALAAGLLSGLPGATAGCAAEDAPAPAPRRLRVRKTVHFRLSRSAKDLGPLRGAARIELRVGDARVPLVEHTTDSLAAARAGTGESWGARTPTHYAARVSFSAQAAQSYFAYRIGAKGQETLVGAAIHLPTVSEQRASALGIVPDDDPREVMTLEDAAIWAVFNNPHVMSHDVETAQKVVDLIQQMPSYGALVEAIDSNFHTVTPEEADELVGGWIIGTYRKLPAAMGGGFAKEVDYAGRELLDDSGAPRRVVDWGISTDDSGNVGAAAMAVTDELVRRFNDDAAFEGVKYFRYPGVGSVGSSAEASAATNAHTTRFLFDVAGKTTEHRRLSVEAEGDELKVVVDNYLALGCLFGVSHFRRDGSHIDTKTLGYVGSTFYPSLAVLGAHSSGEASFERPEDAVTSKVWTCAPAMHHGDLGPHADTMTMTWRAFGGWALSILCDIVIPGAFLSAGLLGASHAGEEIFEHVAKEIGMDAFADVVKGIASTIVNIGEGQSVLSVLKELGLDLVKLFVRLAEKAASSNVLVGVIAKVLAVSGVSTTAAMSTPFVGWTVWAVNTAQTIAQLAMTGVHLIGSTIFTHGTLLYTHPLAVTAKVKDSPYFPSYASHYRATVSLASGASGDDARGFVPLVREGPLPAGTTDTFSLRFLAVPTSLRLRLQVTLFDGDPSGRVNQVGDYLNEDLESEETPGEEQSVAVGITIQPLRVDQNMGLAHDVVFLPSTTLWQKTASAEGDDRVIAFGRVPPSVASLNGLSLRQTSGKESRIAYGFDTQVGMARGAVTADLVNAPAIVASSTPASLSRSAFAEGALRHMLYSLSGRRVILSRATRTVPIDVHVVPANAPEVDLASWTPPSGPHAFSNTPELRAARLTPDGARLLLCSGTSVETFDLGRATSAPQPDLVRGPVLYRRGSRAGCVEAPVAAAGFHHAEQYAVLDVGNARVTVFDYQNNLVSDSPRSPILLATTFRTYLDIDVDVAGNFWLLSVEPGDPSRAGRFFLDIYSAEGKLLRSFFDTVRAMRFALDRFNQLFTLDARVLVGPAGSPEPTVSRWIPTQAAPR